MKNLLLIVFLFCWGSVFSQNWNFDSSKPITGLRSMARLQDEVLAIEGSNKIIKLDYATGTKNIFIADTKFDAGANLTDLFVASNGDIYCVDSANKMVVKFNSNGDRISHQSVGCVPFTCLLRANGDLWVGGSFLEVYQGANKIHTVTDIKGVSKGISNIKDILEVNGEVFLFDRNRGAVQVKAIDGTALDATAYYANSGVFNKTQQAVAFKDLIMVAAQASKIAGEYGLYEFANPLAFNSFVGQMGSSKEGVFGVVAMDNYLLTSDDQAVKKWNYNDVTAPALTINQFQITSSSSISVDYSCSEDARVTIKVLQNGVEIAQQQVDYKASMNNNIVHFNGLTEGETTKVVLQAEDGAGNVSVDVSSNEKILSLSVNMKVLSRHTADAVRMAINTNHEGDLYYVLSDQVDNDTQYTSADQILRDANVVKSIHLTNGKIEHAFNFNFPTTKRLWYVVRDNNNIATNVGSVKIAAFSLIDQISDKVVFTFTGKGTALTEKWVAKHLQYLVDRGNTAMSRVGNYQITSALTPYYLKYDNNSQVDDADRAHLHKLIGEVLFPLSLLYNIEDANNPYYHNNDVRDAIINMFKYVDAREFNASCFTEFKGGGVYLRLTGYFYSALFMRDELIKADCYPMVLATMKWWTNWSLVDFDVNRWNTMDRNKCRNADFTRTFYRNRLITTLMMPSVDDQREVRLLELSRVISEACQYSPGWGGMIKKDYTGYHHRGFWGNAYNADGVREASEMASYLAGTKYALNRSALENLGNYWLANIFYTNKFDISRGVCGRFPTQRSSFLNNSMSVLSLTEALEDGEMKTSLQSHFLSLWNTTDGVKDLRARDVKCNISFSGGFGNWIDANTFSTSTPLAPSSLTSGNRTFPYAAFQVHRHADKMVTVKGFNKYVWDYETNWEQNFFGYQQSNGAMEIIGTNDSQLNMPTAEASGWNANGYDWSHTPGVTGYVIPLRTLKAGFKYARFTFDYFAGGVSLQNQMGMYGFRFYDVRTLNGGNIALRAKKSYTFFGDYVVCMGSNISSTLDRYPVHTTVLQNNLSDISVPTMIDGTAHDGNNYHHEITNNGSVTIEDSRGIAYYIPDAENLNIDRAEQTSRDDRDKKDTQGSFEKIYFNHGNLPSGDDYLYVVSLDGKPLNDKIAAAPADYFKVLQQNSAAHILYSKEKQTYAYSLFKAGEIATDQGVLASSDSDAMVMVKEGDKSIDLSLAHLDLGLLAKDQSFYQVWSIKEDNQWNDSQEQTVTIKLRGHWELLDNAQGKVTLDGYEKETNQTVLTFRCIDAKSVEVKLGSNDDATAVDNEIVSDMKLYPNPTRDIFSISNSKSNKLAKVVVRNICGAIVKNIPAYTFNTTIDLSGFDAGVYSVEVYEDQKSEPTIEKIVKY